MNTNGVDESSNTVMCKVPLTGTRKWLREEEVEAMIKAARHNRHGERDVAMILIAYRHGLRVSELVALQWSDLDFGTGRITCDARKLPSTTRGNCGRSGFCDRQSALLRALHLNAMGQ
jgi:site-specific recombinase XerD